MLFDPPECAARFDIIRTAGRQSGVSGLEVDDYDDYDIVDQSSGKTVAHFYEEYFGNQYGGDYTKPEQIKVDESAKKIVISYVKITTKTKTREEEIKRWDETFSWE